MKTNNKLWISCPIWLDGEKEEEVSNKPNLKNEKSIDDFILKNIIGINVSRYTFDSWMRTYPDSDYEDYMEKQSPNNLLEFISNIPGDYFLNNGLIKDSTMVQSVLLDDDYFMWLNKRKNTQKRRLAYINSKDSHQKMAEKLSFAGLNVSTWHYVLVANGTKKDGAVSTTLSAETVQALREYFKQIINDENFSVFVSKYLVRANEYPQVHDRFVVMAESWFKDGVDVTCKAFETMDMNEQSPVEMLCIPIFVRETHPDGSITVGELREYMFSEFPDRSLHSFPGRYLESIMINGSDLNGIKSIYENKAWDFLRKDLLKIFNEPFPEQLISPYLVPVFDDPTEQTRYGLWL